jgi:hypothetical protein
MIEFHLDSRSGVATYLQIVQQVREALRLGTIDVGDQLPTVHEVVELGDVAICPEHCSDVVEAAVHGTLHLCGLDHEADSGESINRSRGQTCDDEQKHAVAFLPATTILSGCRTCKSV